MRLSDRREFENLVSHLFSQRRKQLRNSLRGRLDEDAFEALGIDPRARAETLDIAHLAALANALHDRRGAI